MYLGFLASGDSEGSGADIDASAADVLGEALASAAFSLQPAKTTSIIIMESVNTVILFNMLLSFHHLLLDFSRI
jgi:hypothetical protein